MIGPDGRPLALARWRARAVARIAPFAAVMIGPDALGGLGAGVLAQLACLAGIFGRRFRRMGVASLATAAGQVSASTVLLLPVMLLEQTARKSGHRCPY